MVRFDALNRTAIETLLKEISDAQRTCRLPAGTDLTLATLDEMITQLECRLEDLDREVATTANVSPNPAKQVRRKLKSKNRKLKERHDKLAEHQEQARTFGSRNSYSKTDHDATFMRVKEPPMMNGQTKPAYNVQFATNHQFIVGFDAFQNPTDTRTLIPFVKKLKVAGVLEPYVSADAGYGSQQNYQFFEDQLSEHTALIPYGTILKEESRRLQSDDRKVMNWDYCAKDDYYVDPKGVRFNFQAYRQRKDKQDGFKRTFKEYQAEAKDADGQPIPAALTPKGYIRKMMVNPEWEYFKAKERELLSDPENAAIYAQSKIDIEPVFGRMKAYLEFKRFHFRGLKMIKRELGIAVIAMNIMKLVGMMA